jgi:hypothetical protein
MVIRRRYEQFARLVEAPQFVQSQRSQRAAMRARDRRFVLASRCTHVSAPHSQQSPLTM